MARFSHISKIFVDFYPALEELDEWWGMKASNFMWLVIGGLRINFGIARMAADDPLPPTAKEPPPPPALDSDDLF